MNPYRHSERTLVEVSYALQFFLRDDIGEAVGPTYDCKAPWFVLDDSGAVVLQDWKLLGRGKIGAKPPLIKTNVPWLSSGGNLDLLLNVKAYEMLFRAACRSGEPKPDALEIAP